MIEIPCAEKQPVQFAGVEYIRVGTNKKNLKEYWKNRGYAEILKESAREKKLSKNLYLEMMMQMYTWSLYSVLCKLKKHVRR